MKTLKLIKTGQQTALISFLSGTGIFGLYFFTSASEILFLGYIFIAITGIINLLILIKILLQARKDKDNRNKLFTTGGLMVINIPVMIIYCWLTILLLGTMRITFTNNTGTTLTKISIFGCSGGHIEQLKNNENKTIWITITGDCSIYINYLQEGKQKEETVAGYVTSGLGQKINHTIDGKDKDIF